MSSTSTRMEKSAGDASVCQTLPDIGVSKLKCLSVHLEDFIREVTMYFFLIFQCIEANIFLN